MKKIVSALIVAALFVCCMVPAAFAAGSTSISISSAEAAVGETVTLSFSIGAAEFATYGATLSYDHDALQLDSIAEGDVKLMVFMPNAAADKVATMGMTNISTEGGVLFTATFTVKEGAEAGKSYPVTITNYNVTDQSAAALAVSVSAGAVKIAVPAHEHDWVLDAEKSVAPTCTAEGSNVYVCSVCGETKSESVAALGHTWGEWAESKAATCTEAGVETRTCSACGETENRDVAALGHAWGEWTVTTAATCTVDGEQTRTCSVCGETETAVIIAEGHAWSEWYVIKEATEEEDGLKERVCYKCGEIEQASFPYLDDLPTTGDITIQLTAGIATVVVAMFAAVAFVFKRKTAK